MQGPVRARSLAPSVFEALKMSLSFRSRITSEGHLADFKNSVKASPS
jgi:hypothetical protein